MLKELTEYKNGNHHVRFHDLPMLFQARRALQALKGLVKLQALVKGHLVRKQTSAIMRRMHAMMAIQVRARVQRIQMAEEAHPAVKRQPPIHRNFTQDNGSRRLHKVSLILCAVIAFFP